MTLFIRSFIFLTITLAASLSHAAVVPEDRADILLGTYKGPESRFDVPSILVRKQYKERVSAWISHTADYNSTASIDVLTQGSPFEEVRIETSGGLDFLNNKTLMSVSYKNSAENDYVARNWSVGLSQDFFGDLSTLTMGYSRGNDDVYRNIRDPQQGGHSGANGITGRTFRGNAYHERFSVGWTQILTRNWILALNGEASVDEGRLENSYRRVRVVGDPIGVEEEYPDTRSSVALAAKSMYYLPWRAAIKLDGRIFNDSWNISAFNYEIKYTHPFGDNIIADFRYRYYDQTQAFFFYDLLAFGTQWDVFSRDKELSTYSNSTLGFSVSYDLKDALPLVERSSLSFAFDYISYDFVNFRDARESDTRFYDVPIATEGNESPYSYTALVPRLIFSVWY